MQSAAATFDIRCSYDNIITADIERACVYFKIFRAIFGQDPAIREYSIPLDEHEVAEAFSVCDFAMHPGNIVTARKWARSARARNVMQCCIKIPMELGESPCVLSGPRIFARDLQLLRLAREFGHNIGKCAMDIAISGECTDCIEYMRDQLGVEVPVEEAGDEHDTLPPRILCRMPTVSQLEQVMAEHRRKTAEQLAHAYDTMREDDGSLPEFYDNERVDGIMSIINPDSIEVLSDRGQIPHLMSDLTTNGKFDAAKVAFELGMGPITNAEVYDAIISGNAEFVQFAHDSANYRPTVEVVNFGDFALLCDYRNEDEWFNYDTIPDHDEVARVICTFRAAEKAAETANRDHLQPDTAAPRYFRPNIVATAESLELFRTLDMAAECREAIVRKFAAEFGGTVMTGEGGSLAVIFGPITAVPAEKMK